MFRLHALCLAVALTGSTARAQAPVAGKAQPPADREDEAVRRLLLRLAPVPLPHSQSLNAVTFSRDGRTVLTVSNNDAQVFLWDSATGKLLRQWRLPGRVSRSAVAAGGKVLAVASGAGSVTLCDGTTGRRLRTVKGTAGPSLALSSDGASLLAGLPDGALGVWDTATGRPRCRLPKSAWSAGLAVAFSADGKRVAATRPNGTIGVWDTATGKELTSLPAGTPDIHLLAFTPDGERLASCDRGGLLRLWDVAAARERRQVQLRGKYAPTCGIFTPDGRALLTGGGDGTVRLWEIASGKERHSFPGRGNGIVCAALAPDGAAVALVGADNLTLVREVSARAAAEWPRAAAPRPKDLPAAWANLADADAATGYWAVAALAGQRDTAVAFLRQHLRPAAALGRREIVQLVHDLNSRLFATRQKAMKRLEGLHEAAEEVIEATLLADPSLEVRRRLDQLLERIRRQGLPPDLLRAVRAVEALETIGTAEARQLLQTLARGARRAALTEEARASLARLAKAPASPR